MNVRTYNETLIYASQGLGPLWPLPSVKFLYPVCSLPSFVAVGLFLLSLVCVCARGRVYVDKWVLRVCVREGGGGDRVCTERWGADLQGVDTLGQMSCWPLSCCDHFVVLQQLD